MKKIKYLLFLAIGLILYSLSSPIYLQYEVNDQFSGYEMYQIENFKGKTVSDSYSAMENMSNVFYINRPESSNEVDLYQINYWFSDFQKKNISQGRDLVIENESADRNSFTISNGYIFLKNSDSVIESLSSKGISVRRVENFYYNQLSRFIIANSFILLILLFFTILFNVAIATTYIKEYALRTLDGQKYSQIVQRFSTEYLTSLLGIQLVIFVIYTIYKAVVAGYQVNLSYFIFYSVLSALMAIILYCIFAVSLLLLKSLRITNVLKNQLFSNELLRLFILGQSFLLVLFPIIMFSTYRSYREMSQSVAKVSEISYLSDYQTYYGTNASLYDSLETEQLLEYEERFHQLYDDLKTSENIYFFSPDYLNYVDSGNPHVANFNMVYMNHEYYTNKAKFNVSMPTLDEQAEKTTILIPSIYKQEIETVLSQVGFGDNNPEWRVIDEGVELIFSDYNFSSENQNFQEIARDKIIVVSEPVNLSNGSDLNILNRFTMGQIFTEISFQEMMAKTQEYGLSNLVTPSSKLSLFEENIENIRYYYTLTLYSFVLSLLGVVMITILTTHIMLSVKKMAITVSFLQGRLGLSNLIMPMFCYFIATLVGTILVIRFTSDLFLIGVNVFMLFCILLYTILNYYVFLKKQIQNILKGE